MNAEPSNQTRPRALPLEFPRRGASAVALAALGLVACGRSGVDAPVDSGDGGPPTSTTPMTSTTSALCAVATNQSPPFDVHFQFRADGAAPVYVHKGCIGLDFGVSSCASGFADALGPVFDCGTCSCAVAESACVQPTCGQCNPDEGAAIAPGASLDEPWTGMSTLFSPRPERQMCETTKILAAAKYRVSIRAFDNEADATKGVGGWIVTKDFALPAPGGVVDVPLGGPGPASCDPTPASAAPACTGHEARDVACDLALGYAYEFVGGELAAWNDSYTIGPPAAFSAQRTYNTQTMHVGPCATTIPRCSADARVVTTSDVTRALAAPSVAAAFGAGTPMYGAQSTFGQYVSIQRSDGKGLAIGDDCAATDSACRPLTDELRAAAPLLRQLAGDVVAAGCPAWVP